MAARLRRERIRDNRPAGRVKVNEILAREDPERVCRVETERAGGGVRRCPGRRVGGRELAQDPAVELVLSDREAMRPGSTLTLRANLGRTERVERCSVAFDRHR